MLSSAVIIILAASALIFKFWRQNIVRRLGQLGVIKLPEDHERRNDRGASMKDIENQHEESSDAPSASNVK